MKEKQESEELFKVSDQLEKVLAIEEELQQKMSSDSEQVRALR